ncbi:hypothetical protein BCV70DRAFT_84071 [Testicularia cyperi]|uniref:Uncharacterized protein n=1 Tax=Testicularia cyperi TaxID=1882483 RepID=A0A317XRE7_9BASI|nr:hypothetical protein BCV70DRAFT_84071 [Testicularia cyperi]
MYNYTMGRGLPSHVADHKAPIQQYMPESAFFHRHHKSPSTHTHQISCICPKITQVTQLRYERTEVQCKRCSSDLGLSQPGGEIMTWPSPLRRVVWYRPDQNILALCTGCATLKRGVNDGVNRVEQWPDMCVHRRGQMQGLVAGCCLSDA